MLIRRSIPTDVAPRRAPEEVPGRCARTIGLALTLLISTASLGCEDDDLSKTGALQGVVELEETILSFEFPGRLAERPVERGDTVQAGQLIARLDETLDRASREAREDELRAAKAQVDLLEAGPKRQDVSALAAQVAAARAVEARIEENLNRERALSERGVTPRAVVDDLVHDLSRAKAERSALEAQLASLKSGARNEEISRAKSQAAAVRSNVKLQSERLERHVLHAPIAGQILEVHAEPGETVAPGTPVATLGDVDHPYVDVFVPQGELTGVRVGRHAEIRIDAIDRVFSGVVEHVARQTEFTPRYLFSERERPNLVVRVRVRVDDPKHELFAGVPAFVTWAAP